MFLAIQSFDQVCLVVHNADRIQEIRTRFSDLGFSDDCWVGDALRFFWLVAPSKRDRLATLVLELNDWDPSHFNFKAVLDGVELVSLGSYESPGVPVPRLVLSGAGKPFEGTNTVRNTNLDYLFLLELRSRDPDAADEMFKNMCELYAVDPGDFTGDTARVLMDMDLNGFKLEDIIGVSKEALREVHGDEEEEVETSSNEEEEEEEEESNSDED